MKRVLLCTLLFAVPMFAADLTGTFPRGERYEPPADHAPAAVSRMFVRAVTDGKVDLPAAGDSGMIIWMIGARGARVTTPTGDVLRPADNGSLERGLRRFQFDPSEAEIDLPKGTSEVFHVMQSKAANYRLETDARAAMVVAAEPDSAITLETWITPLSRQPGEPVTLHARLRNGADAIGGANVSARLASPRGAAGKAVELIDRGDGVYTATIADLTNAMPGTWQARFEANGETANGVRFARTGGGEFVAERGAARLESVRAERVDGVLRVTARADVAIAGAYRLDVIVAGPKDESGVRAALAWGEGVRQLARGISELTLDVPVDAAGEVHADVRLLGLDTIGVAGRVTLDVR